MNTILTSAMVTRESSRVLANALRFGTRVSRKYDNRFAQSGAKIGSTLDIRIPPRYIASDSEGLVLNDSNETVRTLEIKYSHVGLELTNTELLLSINDFSDQILQSAVATLANRIDLRGTELYKDVPNLVGTIGGGAPTSLATYLELQAKLTEEAVPQDDRWTLCINAAMNEKIVDALKGLFHSQPQLKEQYEMGHMMRAVGFDWLTDQNMFLHTNGDRGAAVGDVNGANQTGTSLIADGFAANATIKRGEVFTLGVNAVNPQSRQSTGRLRQFVVTADATADGTGAVTLSIYPPIQPAGKDQTVDAAVADNTVITFNGAASLTGNQGLGFHRDAFSVTFVDESVKSGVSFFGRTSAIDAQEWKVSVAIIRDYEITPHRELCRIGAYYGWVTARPEMACRVTT